MLTSLLLPKQADLLKTCFLLKSTKHAAPKCRLLCAYCNSSTPIAGYKRRCDFACICKSRQCWLLTRRAVHSLALRIALPPVLVRPC